MFEDYDIRLLTRSRTTLLGDFIISVIVGSCTGITGPIIACGGGLGANGGGISSSFS